MLGGPPPPLHLLDRACDNMFWFILFSDKPLVTAVAALDTPRAFNPYVAGNAFNSFKPEFTVVIVIHYKPRISRLVVDEDW